MRVSWAKTTTCLLILSAALILASTPVSANVPDRPIPCGTITETFSVLNGLDPIYFNNHQDTNGTHDSFSWTCRQTYQVSYKSISPPQAFVQWTVSGGTLSNLLANPTTFTPTSSVGQIALILGNNNMRWAGYVGVGPVGSAFTDVYLDFRVPSSLSYHSGGVNQGWPFCWSEDLLIWAGIGGWQGSGNLWQAGLDISVYRGALFCPSGIQFHAISGDTGRNVLVPATLDSGWGNTHVHLGDTMTISLHYDRASNSGSGSVCDASDSGFPCWSFSLGNLQYPPDQSSEDFVAEVPGRGSTPPGNAIPTFNSFLMFGSTSNVFNFPPDSPASQWWAPQTVNGIYLVFYPGIVDVNGYWAMNMAL